MIGRAWWIAVLAAGLSLLAAGWLLGREPALPPNVVFILVDTLRADRMGAQRNGEPVTPFLTRLAGESVYFPNGVSPSSWTRPAMASLLTSTYVDTHQVYFSIRNEDPEQPVSDALSTSFETMAEYLTRHGYDAWACQTNVNLTEALGFAQGYPEGHYLFSNGARADFVTGKALEALPTLKPPFFLYAHYMDPHAPYDAPEAYRSLFGPEPSLRPEEQQRIAPDRFIDYLVDRVETVQGVKTAAEFPTLSPEGMDAVRQRYDAEVRFADDQVARLVEALRRAYPNTLFVVLSDHGEEFWEHGGLGHGTSLYEEQIRVPLMFSGPGLTPRRIEAAVETLGLLPSIAAYLGLPPNPAWQGRSLLTNPDAAPDAAFARTKGPWANLRVDLDAVVHEDHKLVLDHTRSGKALFRLDADPAEKRDLAGQDPARTAQLEEFLARHRDENLRRHAAQPVSPAPAIDAETIERLQGLGYLGTVKEGEHHAIDPDQTRGRPVGEPLPAGQER